MSCYSRPMLTRVVDSPVCEVVLWVASVESVVMIAGVDPEEGCAFRIIAFRRRMTISSLGKLSGTVSFEGNILMSSILLYSQLWIE